MSHGQPWKCFCKGEKSFWQILQKSFVSCRWYRFTESRLVLSYGMEGYTGFNQGQCDDGVGGDILWIIPGVKALQADVPTKRWSPDVLQYCVFVAFQEVAHYIYMPPEDVRIVIHLLEDHDVSTFDERWHWVPSYIDCPVYRRHIRYR